jgi:hypothetical protein
MVIVAKSIDILKRPEKVKEMAVTLKDMVVIHKV